ncbi:MAG: oxidative damage protection protein [Burkholderiaceae bacterium]|jgi:Fe-S cluster biosynthesis and repair protein YggX|nr:oxidative damage protection protein [Burkholderiaceae bacterium]
MSRTVRCVRLGKEARGLDFPPYPGEMGKRIYENISKEAWDGWVRRQTMLVNEYRLNVTDASARQFLAEQMQQFLFESEGESPIQPHSSSPCG